MSEATTRRVPTAKGPSKAKTAKAAVAPTEDALSALVEKARLALDRDGAVARAKLGAATTRELVATRLAALGFEVTPKVVRVPVAEQLRRALADGAFQPRATLAQRLAGVSAKEAAAAIDRLVKDGAARIALRTRVETVVPATADVLSVADVRAVGATLAALAKQVGAAQKKPALTLLRADVADALRALSELVQARRAPSAAELLAAIHATRDEDTGLSFVPAVVRTLRSHAAHYSQEAILASLVEAARADRIELRPESGLQRLDAEELRLCPPGPQDTRLSWTRTRTRTEPST